jgi:hypothetical protein
MMVDHTWECADQWQEKAIADTRRARRAVLEYPIDLSRIFCQPQVLLNTRIYDASRMSKE